MTTESTRLKVPAVRTGAIVTALFTITIALALFTVIRFGLLPKIVTKPAPVTFNAPISDTRIDVLSALLFFVRVPETSQLSMCTFP